MTHPPIEEATPAKALTKIVVLPEGVKASDLTPEQIKELFATVGEPTTITIGN